MVVTGVCGVTGQRARAAQQVERDPPLLQVQVDLVAVVGRLRPRSRAVVQRDHHTKARAKAKHERLDRHSNETDDVINGVANISIKDQGEGGKGEGEGGGEKGEESHSNRGKGGRHNRRVFDHNCDGCQGRGAFTV